LGLKVGFISNGFRQFDKTLQAAIRKSKPFAVGLSVDGVKEIHNQVRRNEKSWQGLMHNISVLQRAGTQICAITTLHKLNCNELPRLANFLDLAEIDSWQLQLALPFGRMKRQTDLLVSENDFKNICKTVLSLRQSHPQLNIQAADCFGMAPENSIRSDCWSGCAAGICSMAIDACGNVMPCLSLQGGRRQDSLRKKPLAEIWKNSVEFDFNRIFDVKTVTGRCAGCNFLSECRGGCNSQSFSYYGCFHSSPFCFIRSFHQ
jgi:radical SAM protein with 4Fe4S-binding SPASM domain